MYPPRATSFSGADVQNRTGDLVLTKDALCQLSYIGLRLRLRPTSRPACLSPRATWLASHSSRISFPAASGGWSGRRGSNPRPTAWKAVTLPLSYSRLRGSLTLPTRRFGGQARRCAANNSIARSRLQTRRSLRVLRFPPLACHPKPAFRLRVLRYSGQAAEGWPANRSSLDVLASEGWWRGKDSNLRSR